VSEKPRSKAKPKPELKPEPKQAVPKASDDLEGKRIIKVEIRYVGHATVDEARLRGLIATRVGEDYSAARIDTDMKSLYESGYIDDVRVLAEPAGDGLRVIYEVNSRGLIDSGTPTVSLVGNTAFSDERLVVASRLASGRTVNPHTLADARGNLEEYYHSHGYRKAKVKLGWDGEDFKFLIEEGPRTKE
jgi:outer membrane protein insertion porin family